LPEVEDDEAAPIPPYRNSRLGNSGSTGRVWSASGYSTLQGAGSPDAPNGRQQGGPARVCGHPGQGAGLPGKVCPDFEQQDPAARYRIKPAPKAFGRIGSPGPALGVFHENRNVSRPQRPASRRAFLRSRPVSCRPSLAGRKPNASEETTAQLSKAAQTFSARTVPKGLRANGARKSRRLHAPGSRAVPPPVKGGRFRTVHQADGARPQPPQRDRDPCMFLLPVTFRTCRYRSSETHRV